jgi:phosphoribosylaminoimidazolecarboxamide formyltransferase/IMP cyclohydrolase
MSVQTELRKWALISLTDKEGCEKLASEFLSMGFGILSSGGTARYLSDRGIEVTDISDFTGEEERFGGRVKTLHHKVYSSLLLRPDESEDLKQWTEGHQIAAVACNFYPFEEKSKQCKDLVELSEWIDIGGPCMVRAAAKNFPHVWIFVNQKQQEEFISLSAEEREAFSYRSGLAKEAFSYVQKLDTAILDALESGFPRTENAGTESGWTTQPELKYGENPHQEAEFNAGLGAASFLGPVGFNNIRDAEAAWKFVSAFPEEQSAVSVVKHQTLCGAAAHPDLSKNDDVFQWAWEGDTVSRFGGVLAFNHVPASQATETLQKSFVEILVLPHSAEAQKWCEELHSKKPRCRMILVDQNRTPKKESYAGKLGTLLQSPDRPEFSKEGNFLESVSSWMGACSKSNAIVLSLLTPDGTAVMAGAGQGQPNRIDAFSQLAWPRAKNFLARFEHFSVKDLLLYSDAFLPFPDLIEEMAKAELPRLLQPGGSKNDGLVAKKAEELKIEMKMTGKRHFWH